MDDLTTHTPALCADCGEEVDGPHRCEQRRPLSELERVFFLEQRRQLVRMLALAMKRRRRRP